MTVVSLTSPLSWFQTISVSDQRQPADDQQELILSTWLFLLDIHWKSALGTYFYQPLNGNQATDAFIWLIFPQCLVWKLYCGAEASARGASPIFRGPGGPALTSHPSFLYIKGEILTQSLLRQHEMSTLLKCRSKQCHINLSGPKCSMHGCYRCSDHHSPMIFCLAVVNNMPSIISWNLRAWP